MRSSSGPEQLVYLFSKLPGLGLRSARRIVFHLLQNKEVRLKSIIDSLTSAFENVMICEICGNMDYTKKCNICLDPLRDNSIIAIVETVADLWAIERSSSFKGRYHVLGGVVSSFLKKDPEDLRLPLLLQRCKTHNTEELIIATNATLDGQTTAYFITDFFTNHAIKTSRLANGIPIGGELDYLDEGTLSMALERRVPFK